MEVNLYEHCLRFNNLKARIRTRIQEDHDKNGYKEAAPTCCAFQVEEYKVNGYIRKDNKKDNGWDPGS